MECGRGMCHVGTKFSQTIAGWLILTGWLVSFSYAQGTATAPAETKFKLESSGLSLATNKAAFFSTNLNLRQG